MEQRGGPGRDGHIRKGSDGSATATFGTSSPAAPLAVPKGVTMFVALPPTAVALRSLPCAAAMLWLPQEASAKLLLPKTTGGRGAEFQRVPADRDGDIR